VEQCVLYAEKKWRLLASGTVHVSLEELCGEVFITPAPHSSEIGCKQPHISIVFSSIGI